MALVNVSLNGVAFGKGHLASSKSYNNVEESLIESMDISKRADALQRWSNDGYASFILEIVDDGR